MNLLARWRLRNEMKWQKRVVAVAQESSTRAMRARERKFANAPFHPGQYVHPKDNRLVTKKEVADDVKRVGDWVLHKEIDRFLDNPKELVDEERVRATYKQRGWEL